MKRPELEQALGRLLGPAEPEIGCDECFDQLDRYVGLELAGGDTDTGFQASARISTAAPPAARSTRACARSSAASRSLNRGLTPVFRFCTETVPISRGSVSAR